MPKRTRAPGGGREGAGSASGGQQVRSDEEILQERRRQEAFDAADAFLNGLSWGLWALALVWFFVFASAAPVVASLHSGAGDAVLALLVCGLFCGSLSRASRRGSWSSWRRPWQLGWGPVLLLLAVAAFTGSSKGVSRSCCVALAAACVLPALGAVLTSPSGEPKPARGAGAPLGRGLLLLDGALGLLLGGSMLLWAPWQQPLGAMATFVQALPMVMWALGSLCCSSEAELVAAVPAALAFHVAAAVRSCVMIGPMAALPVALLAVWHGALYLPLPVQDPNSNPFHTGLARYLRQSAKILTDPVPGFGGED